MEKLFNIAEQFSKSLNEIRGPERKNRYLKKAIAWVRPSGIRRGTVKTFAFGGITLAVGALGISLYRYRRQLREVEPRITGKRRTQEIRELGRERIAG